MKGRKGCKAGGAESPKSGDKEFEQDLKSKPESRTNSSKIDKEAEERKHGGRTKKHVGKVHGHKMEHAGRKPRMSGGSCDSSPFSSARKGMPAKGRKAALDID